MCLKLKKGAIFVADSHFNEKNQEFLIFLEELSSKKIETSQLFLMGDNFDFISGESRYFIKKNKRLIDLINKLSASIEIIYLEGNHDFNLKSIFPHVKVYKREEQPVQANYENKSIALSHGDIFTPWHYDLYCKIIRNHFLLVFLNILDINYFISKKIYYGLLDKEICFTMKDFKSFALKRINNYKNDIIIEGHFHQGKTHSENEKLYINIPSLCCNKQYFLFDGNFKGIDL